MDAQKIEQGVRLILEGMGEDPTREGLLHTPARISRACAELLAGVDADPRELFGVTFEAHHTEPVIVCDIEFHSMCEHHLLPFFGRAHIAYIPAQNGRVCGLSKLARVVELYARRLQLQERLCDQIARAIEENLDAQGVLVVIEARHMCMEMRGVSKSGALTITTSTRGIFVDDTELTNRTLTLFSKGA